MTADDPSLPTPATDALVPEAGVLARPDMAATDSASPLDAVRLLIDEAKASVDAELTLAKTIGRVAGQSLQRMAVWGTIALLFAFVGLLAFAVGVTIALAQIIGPLGAAFVVGGLLLGTGIFAGLRARANLLTLQKAAKLVVE